MPRHTRIACVTALVAGALAMAGCAGGGSSDSTTPPVAGSTTGSLNLYGYSVAKAAYEKVIPGFVAGPGAGVQVRESYGASGDQSRKVAAGAAADIVSFSTDPDITRLVDAGLVAKDWNAGPAHGAPFGSVVTIVVRKGNPLGIEDWPDLVKPGVEVVTPNPFSSGSAKWNLLAPYAAQSSGGRDPAAGLAYLETLIGSHIHVQPGSAREATETFLQGTGDVLLSYEDEAIALERMGSPVEHVTAPQTVKIETPVAVTANSANPTAARAFLDYLYTPGAQRRFAAAGFRPTDPQIATEFSAAFPAPARLWTIADLGGWAKVDADMFAKGTGTIAVLYAKATR